MLRQLGLIVLLAEVLVPQAAGANVTMNVCSMMTDTGGWASFADEFRANNVLWGNYVTKIGGIPIHNGADRVQVNFVNINVGATTTAAMHVKVNSTIALNFARRNGSAACHVLISPYSTPLTETAAVSVARYMPGTMLLAAAAGSDHLYMCDSILLSPCLAPNIRRFPTLFTTSFVASALLGSFVATMNSAKAKTVAIIGELTDYPKYVTLGARNQVSAYGMTVVLDITVPFISSPAALETNRIALQQAAAQIVAINADFVVAAVYSDFCTFLIREFKRLGYTPKLSIAMTICVGSAATELALGDDFKYVFGLTNWVPGLVGSSYAEDVSSPVGMYIKSHGVSAYSPRLYANAFEAQTGAGPSFQSAQHMASLHVIHMAVVIAGTIDSPALLLNAVQSNRLQGHLGVIAFDRFGLNIGQTAVLSQYDSKRQLKIIEPASSRQMDPIIGMPTWASRFYNPVMFGTFFEQITLNVTSIAIALIIIFIAVIVYYRNATIVKASSFSLLIVTQIGGIGCICVNYVWALYATTLHCILRPLISAIAFSLLFSPLFVKTLRLYLIFFAKDLSRKKSISKRMTSMLLLVPVVIDTIIMSIWIIVSAPTTVLITDDLRPANNRTICSTEMPFLTIMLLWKGAHVASGAMLMFISRNIPSMFNETSSILFSITAVVLGGGILIPIAATSGIDPDFQYLLRSFGIIGSVMITIIALVLPKYLFIHDAGVDVKPDTMTNNLQRGSLANSYQSNNKTNAGNAGQIFTIKERPSDAAHNSKMENELATALNDLVVVERQLQAALLELEAVKKENEQLKSATKQ